MARAARRTSKSGGTVRVRPTTEPGLTGFFDQTLDFVGRHRRLCILGTPQADHAEQPEGGADPDAQRLGEPDPLPVRGVVAAVPGVSDVEPLRFESVTPIGTDLRLIARPA